MAQDQKSNEKKSSVIWLVIVVLIILSVVIVFLIRGSTPSTPESIPTLTSASPSDTIPSATQPDAQLPLDTPTGVATLPPIPTETLAFYPTTVIKQEFVDVHTGPGEQYPIIERLFRGDTVRVLGTNTDRTWLFILLEDQRQGWIPVDSVEITFDLEKLPIVEAPPTPEPYGLGFLAPPDLRGTSPSTPGSMGRRTLAAASVSIFSVSLFGIFGINIMRRRATRKPFLARAIQFLSSLL